MHDAFYNSQGWKKTREAYRKSVGGLCEMCLKQGLYVPGEIVHHIVPITDDNVTDPTITLSWSNLTLLCREHHALIHSSVRKDFRYEFGPNGEIIPR